MKQELTWFQLRFPRDLDESAVLAALSSFSGVPHRTRLAFDLSATSSSIEHRLAVSPAATDMVTGSLRAAIPSLRLDAIEAPPRTYRRRVLWQLNPTLAAIRVDELGAIAASLLASLFPLGQASLSVSSGRCDRRCAPPRASLPRADGRAASKPCSASWPCRA